MSNPTTGEWTAQTVFDLMDSDYGGDGWKREHNVADAHNAALAAAYKKGMEDGIKAAGLTTRI